MKIRVEDYVVILWNKNDNTLAGASKFEELRRSGLLEFEMRIENKRRVSYIYLGGSVKGIEIRVCAPGAVARIPLDHEIVEK